MKVSVLTRALRFLPEAHFWSTYHIQVRIAHIQESWCMPYFWGHLVHLWSLTPFSYIKNVWSASFLDNQTLSSWKKQGVFFLFCSMHDRFIFVWQLEDAVKKHNELQTTSYYEDTKAILEEVMVKMAWIPNFYQPGFVSLLSEMKRREHVYVSLWKNKKCSCHSEKKKSEMQLVFKNNNANGSSFRKFRSSLEHIEKSSTAAYLFQFCCGWRIYFIHVLYLAVNNYLSCPTEIRGIARSILRPKGGRYCMIWWFVHL